jgi:hypothetical protein
LRPLATAGPSLQLEPSPAAALLRAGDQVFSLRQKNTSNALILLAAVGESSLGAIATLHETVELVPETGGTGAAPAKGKWHERFGRRGVAS